MKTLISIMLSTMSAGVVFAANDSGAGQHKAVLSGWNEVPAVVTGGKGEFSAKVADDGKSIDVTLTVSGLAGDAQTAELRLAQAGATGPAVVTLCGGSHPACPKRDGSVSVTLKEADVSAADAQGLAAGDLAALLDAMKHGAVYVNVTSARFADGEVRGQVGRGMHGGSNMGGDDADSGSQDTENGNGKGKGHAKGN